MAAYVPSLLPPKPNLVPNAPAPSPALPFGNWTPALFVPYRRSIGGIVAQVTIEEQHTDEVQITDHPVEAGAPVSDHAFKRPVQINITAGWSRAVAYDLSAESGVYGLLLSWQAAFMPFDVYTGKRHYTNMLMERLVVTTDQHSEFSLMAQISCREVIIVRTSTSKAQTTSDQAGSQQEPDKTAPPKENGETPTEKPSSPQEASVTQTTKTNDPGGSVSGEKGVSLETPADYAIGPSGTPGAFTGQEGVTVPVAPQPPPSPGDYIEPPPAGSLPGFNKGATPAQITSP